MQAAPAPPTPVSTASVPPSRGVSIDMKDTSVAYSPVNSQPEDDGNAIYEEIQACPSGPPPPPPRFDSTESDSGFPPPLPERAAPTIPNRPTAGPPPIPNRPQGPPIPARTNGPPPIPARTGASSVATPPQTPRRNAS